MENLLTAAFEAHHSAADRHRRYEVAVGRDLFGGWTVTLRYGRVGRPGQERRYASPDADAMRAVVRDHLLRRLSAPRRIGCAYRLVRLETTAHFDTDGWLPTAMMERFSTPA